MLAALAFLRSGRLNRSYGRELMTREKSPTQASRPQGLVRILRGPFAGMTGVVEQLVNASSVEVRIRLAGEDVVVRMFADNIAVIQ